MSARSKDVVMYGFVWVCMGMYGYVCVCMGMYWYVWLSIGVVGVVGTCLLLKVQGSTEVS